MSHWYHVLTQCVVCFIFGLLLLILLVKHRRVEHNERRIFSTHVVQLTVFHGVVTPDVVCGILGLGLSS